MPLTPTTVTYTCELSRGDPDVSVVWELAGDQNLKNNSNFFIANNALSSSLVVTTPEKVGNKKLRCILKSTSDSVIGSSPPCEGPVSIIVYSEWLSHRRNTYSLYVQRKYKYYTIIICETSCQLKKITAAALEMVRRKLVRPSAMVTSGRVDLPTHIYRI